MTPEQWLLDRNIKTEFEQNENEALNQTDVSGSFSDINVYDIGIIKALKVKTFEDIKKSKRLFLGELINHSQRTGMFVEIKDVPKFIKAEEYLQKKNIKHNCLEESYIEWHNFHVIL
jgi:hypothetical protein